MLGVDYHTYAISAGWQCLGRTTETFWQRYADKLGVLLAAAHAGWKAKQKQCHDRKLRAAHYGFWLKRIDAKILRINLAWEFVEAEFKKHGTVLYSDLG